MAIALVASVGAKSTNGDGFTSAGINTTGASLLVAGVSSYTAIGTANPTDSKGNTWTGLTDRAVVDSRCRLFYVGNPTVGTSHTFTISTAQTYAALSVCSFSGVVTTSPFDVENGGTSTGATSLATGSVTPSENDEVVVASLGLRNLLSVGDTATIDSGFTQETALAGVAAQCLGGAIAYKVQTTAAAVNPTFSWSNSYQAAAAIGTFKVAAGGTTRGMPFAGGTAFNGGRTLVGNLR